MSLSKKAKDCWDTNLKKDSIGELVPCLVSSESLSQKKDFSSDNKSKFQTLEVTTNENITKITLNRPEKKNALSYVMYDEIIQALKEAGEDESTITVVTGNGDYFSNGNDLNNLTEIKTFEKLKEDMNGFVSMFIDFPKPLIAVVNGPALGIAVTILGLFDTIYATDRATFQTPFVQLGLLPEGCSSYTFPIIMGPNKAKEMLLFNKKLTAVEACKWGLVTEVFPHSTFQKEVWTRLKAYAKLPKNCLVLSKQLIRGMHKEKLHATSTQEVEQIVKIWLSEEFKTATACLLKKKSKL
uniref:Enoyl-CoA delta isomerase 2, mitochondrial-like n=1 Tax=Geotrypetes seraphini TaxID=260995 RepID=A0A6P8QUX5_GEOSA|nr:enoyl-CoA delta isomerase 2, mitochondrial-like [Geotrypetes seraphini]